MLDVITLPLFIKVQRGKSTTRHGAISFGQSIGDAPPVSHASGREHRCRLWRYQPQIAANLPVALAYANNRLHLVGGHELRQGGFRIAGRADCQRDGPFAPVFAQIRQFLDLFATIPGSPWYANTLYHAIIRQRALKHAEVASTCKV